MENLNNNNLYKLLNKAEFKCQRCSSCCRKSPGVVFLTKEDAEKIINYLKISMNDFINKYCREIFRNDKSILGLLEKPNFDCIFWENGGCAVYQARPIQCVTYPYWPVILESENRWNNEMNNCLGINKKGSLTIEDKINYYILEKNAKYMEYPKDL
jgi:uncharacterized protein